MSGDRGGRMPLAGAALAMAGLLGVGPGRGGGVEVFEPRVSVGPSRPERRRHTRRRGTPGAQGGAKGDRGRGRGTA